MLSSFLCSTTVTAQLATVQHNNNSQPTFLWRIRDDLHIAELFYGVGHTHPTLDGTPSVSGLNEESFPVRVDQLVTVCVTISVLCQGHLCVVELQRERYRNIVLRQMLMCIAGNLCRR